MVADSDRPTTVLSVQKYESGPPVATTSTKDGQLVSADGDVLATSKQEEWVTKKKTELVTTKQIETRVKRQVVLEDGKVVEDTGPLVTTTTTEDTDKNESEQTEHKQHGSDPDIGEGWVPVENIPEDAVIKEMNERKITTHDEVEDVLETEEVKHLGDVSSEILVRAIREGSGDTRKTFLTADRNELIPLSPYDRDYAAQRRRVLQQSRRHDRTTDIEDTKEVSKFNDAGNLVTEITKRHEHEDFHNEDIPDSDSDEFEHIEDHEGTHDYSHAKNENYVEYLSVPKGGSLSHGVKIGEGARLVSENISSQRQGDDELWESVSERLRRNQPQQQNGEENKLSRSDALTSRPLDFSQEEHTRKHETNRWLNSHFGSSSSSLNSETSPLSPIQSTPKGIHVTMTSRTSPFQTSPPPPPPLLGKGGIIKSDILTTGKRITFEDESPRPSPVTKDVKFDLRNRHDDVMRSLNSQFGRATVTKSGERLWDETPTPPPRSRRRNSPDTRQYVRSPDHNTSPTQSGSTMQSRKFDSEPYKLQKSNDKGERKSFERREESFGYTGSTQHPLSRESFESGNFGDGYVTKHNDYYKTNETNNPAQNAHYENGQADVTGRKTVERREQNFSYNGPSQKQFHPKYILGVPASTVGRLKGIEATGAVVEEDHSSNAVSRHAQSLPRRRFYFGDDEGSLGNKHPQLEPKRSGGYGKPKELRFGGSDDINVTVSNNYSNDTRKTSSLNRSMSFTPSSLREKPTRFSSNRIEPVEQQSPRNPYIHKSNPHLVDSPDLLSPRLINILSRSSRDVNNSNTWNQNERNTENVYSNRYDDTNSSNHSQSKRTFLDNIKKSSSELLEPRMNRAKATSPTRSMTPTSPYSPLSRAVATRSPKLLSSGRTSSPGLSDDYHETYRMTSSTPDEDVSKPRISTDTTSKFSRKTLRNMEGQPSGKVESSETTTRTKSRFKESEVMYPNGQTRRVGSPASFRTGSPASFRTDFKPETTTGGSVIIPVRDPNNNKHVHYAK